jgi:hypothetical protein
MRILAILAAALALVSVSTSPVLAANPAMKACAAKWSDMKKDGSAKGKTYKEFSTECLAGAKAGETGKPAAVAAAVTAEAPAPTKKPSLMSRLLTPKPASGATSPPPAPASPSTPSTAGDTGGHPQCKKGKPCGHSCIAMDKVCHKS